MHEIGIVNGILKTVIDTAREAGASRVVSVKLRIGDMCEVVPESLDFDHDRFHLRCPACGSPQTRLLQGRELGIVSMEVETDDDFQLGT